MDNNLSEKLDFIYKTGTKKDVEEFLTATYDSLAIKVDANPADIIFVCNELGGLYREQSRYEESIINFKIALDKTEALLGTKISDEYAICLINIAGTYRYKGEVEHAIELYHQAEDILKQLGKEQTYEYASVLNNLSNALQDKGDFAQAMQCTLNAYEIMRPMTQGRAEESVSMMNIAALAWRMGDLDKASEYAKKAVQIYDSLNRTGGHYNAAVNMCAVIDFKKGNYQQALDGFQRAAELSLANQGQNRDYASALDNAAMALDKLNRATEAKEYRQRAQNVRENLK